MPSCLRCQKNYSSEQFLNIHKNNLKICDRNIVKNLFINSELVCKSGCVKVNGTPLKFASKKYLMIHYQKHCKLITESERNIILGKDHGEGRNNTDVISENINNETTGPLTSQAENILNSIGLFFHRPYGLVQCLKCSSIFQKSFFEHARKNHNFPIVRKNCKNLVFDALSPILNNSPYYGNRNNNLLASIHFLQIFDGFKCTSCVYYCKDIKTSNVHAIKQHDGNLNVIVPCFVQTISKPNARLKKYFGVFARQDNPISQQLYSLGSIDLFIAADDEINKEIAADSKRGVFFERLNWWTLTDNHNNINISEILSLPVNEVGIEYEMIKKVFIDYVRRVSGINASIRMIFRTENSKKKGYNKKTFEIPTKSNTYEIKYLRNQIPTKYLRNHKNQMPTKSRYLRNHKNQMPTKSNTYEI